MKAEAQAKKVNIYGGLLQFMDAKVLRAANAELELTNLSSGEEARARTAAVRRTKDGTVLGVAVELLPPSETFGGLIFRLKKTPAELQRLDQAIKSGNIDPRVLREFRDAVDYVRKTAWLFRHGRSVKRNSATRPQSFRYSSRSGFAAPLNFVPQLVRQSEARKGTPARTSGLPQLRH